MKAFRIFTLTLALLPLISSPATSQISEGGKPVSFQRALKKDPPVVTMPAVDVNKLLAEDSVEQEMGLPFRFGFAHEVNLDLNNSGVWEVLDDGSKVWRLAIRCPGAFSINLIYDDFQLPPGAKLHLYSSGRDMLMGAFTARNNKEHGKFATSPVKGEMTILEYYLPSDAVDPGRVSIRNVVHGYKPVFFDRENLTKLMDFGESGDCNINVHCPEGEDWSDEIRSVVLYMTALGTRLCSGVMLNNVREDATPYLLTANHCALLGGVETWVFIFNYESPTCENIDGPTWMTVAGATLRSSYVYSDFALIELSEQPPESYNVFYAGWSAVDKAAISSIGIHHPWGDIKKLAYDLDTLTSTTNQGLPGDNYWQIGWWDAGTTEPGSSGSPLFNENHLVVGQLYGGKANCTVGGPDWYGKFARSWDYYPHPGRRLKDWLDPDNTGTLVLGGLGDDTPDPPIVSFMADTLFFWSPHAVNFTGLSSHSGEQWSWDFGDGGTADIQSPSHTFSESGIFAVRADMLYEGEVYSRTRYDYIYVLSDTLIGEDIEAETGSNIVMSVRAHNLLPLNVIIIPCEFGGELPLMFDSFSTVGCRTDYFARQDYKHWDIARSRVTIRLQTDIDGIQPELERGEGEIVKLYFTVPESAQLGQTTSIQLDGYLTYLPLFRGSVAGYEPRSASGSVTATSLSCCTGIRGNVDDDLEELVSSVDVMYFVEWLFLEGPSPACFKEADVDRDGVLCILDVDYLVKYLWMGGPAPAACY